MKVHIYKNLFGFSNFLIFIDTKEVFINKSFENISTALICLRKNAIDRTEVNLSSIKGKLTLEQELPSYINEHRDELEIIKEDLEKRNLEYSWLQMLQLLVLNKENGNLDSNIANLSNFYDKNIQNEITI